MIDDLKGFKELSEYEAACVSGGSQFVVTSLATVKLFIDNILIQMSNGIPLIGIVTVPVQFVIDAGFRVFFSVASLFTPIPNTNPTV